MELHEWIGIGLAITSLYMIVLFLWKSQGSFFNLAEIVKNHLKLFSYQKIQYVDFFVLPASFSIGLALLYVADGSFYSNLIVIVSILLSMLFAILGVLTNLEISDCDKVRVKRAKKTLEETINAILFDSILGVLLLLYGLAMIVADSAIKIHAIKVALSGGIYYIFTVFTLTLLLIVKRMSRLVKYRMRSGRKA